MNKPSMRETASFLRSSADHAAQAGYPHTLPAVHSEADAAVQALALTSSKAADTTTRKPGECCGETPCIDLRFGGRCAGKAMDAHQAAKPRELPVQMLDTEPALDSLFLSNAGRQLQDACHAASYEAGWWKHQATGLDLRIIVRDKQADPLLALLAGALVAQKLCLTHSEISEGMEGHRKGRMDDKLPHRPMLEVELADAIIRAFDLAGALDYDLGGAIAEKLAFNAVRPDHKLEARAATGGKAY